MNEFPEVRPAPARKATKKEMIAGWTIIIGLGIANAVFIVLLIIK